MPPRKRAAKTAGALCKPDYESPPTPTDKELGDAIRRYRELRAEYERVYDEMMRAREHVVTELRLAGVIDFTGL